MEMEVLNAAQICRTCKCVTPHMRSVFEGFENPHQSPRIDEMLMACASVQVICGDGLPSTICQVCLEQLKNAFYFKRQAEKVDASLRDYAKTIKVNEIKQELQNSEFMESLNTLNSLLNENVSTVRETIQPESVPQPVLGVTQPRLETDYIQFLDNNQMLLTCRECAKIFTTLEGLRCHKRVHTGGMYKCKQCDKEYTRLNHLQRHEQSHNRRKVHVCRICSKTLTRMEHLKRHLVTHLKEKPFSCKTCNRGFNRIEHLHNHAPRCKGDTVYPCDICNKAFNREDSLEVHKKMHDNQAPKLPTIDNLDNIEDHYYQIDQDTNMTFSDHSDDDADNLDNDDYFEPQVEVNENIEGETEAEEKVKVIPEIPIPENEDSNASDGSVGGDMSGVGGIDIDNDNDIDNDEDKDNEVNDHSSSLEKDINESEEIDDKKDVVVEEHQFSDIGEDHMIGEDHVFDDDVRDDVIEGEIDGDVGDDSGGYSTDSDYLPKKQLKAIPVRKRGRPRKNPDSPPKPKKPKVPGRGRGRPPTKGLIKREKEEEEEGEFPCIACGEMFNTLMKLDKHAKMQHDGIKVHKCAVCSKDFLRANHLKRHLTCHSPIKPFRCTACPKSFNRRDHLNQHQKLHERQNEYECDICQKPFNRADHLAKHKASKHGIGDKVCDEEEPPKKQHSKFRYSLEHLKAAVTEVREGRMSAFGASKYFNVPRSTLNNKIHGKSNIETRKMGPARILTPEEENMLEYWILYKTRIGFPMYPDEVKDAAKVFIEVAHRANPFKENRPGRKWLQGFLATRPNVAQQNAEIISEARAIATEQDIKNWFLELKHYLEEEKALGILEDSDRIFSADQTNFQLCLETGEVLGPKRYKNFHDIGKITNERGFLTVFTNFSAAGKIAPTYIIYPEQRVTDKISKFMPENFYVGMSKTGSLMGPTFSEYIETKLYPWLVNNNINLPILLLLDGHKYHISFETSAFCRAKGILLYCLLPNAIHLLQPYDVAIFKPLKEHWEYHCLKYKQEKGEVLTDALFSHIFAEVFKSICQQNTVRNAFCTCGLFPFNVNNVDFEYSLNDLK